MTDPVGVTPPGEAAAATVTESVCAVVIDVGDGVTVTVGATGALTVTEPVPEDVLYDTELAESGVYVAVSESVPTGSVPLAMLIVAELLLSVVAADV
jgi:hypothetical protein